MSVGAVTRNDLLPVCPKSRHHHFELMVYAVGLSSPLAGLVSSANEPPGLIDHPAFSAASMMLNSPGARASSCFGSVIRQGMVASMSTGTDTYSCTRSGHNYQILSFRGIASMMFPHHSGYRNGRNFRALLAGGSTALPSR